MNLLYDLFGKVILQQLIHAQQESLLVDLSNNNKGVYLIKIVSENSNYTEKVILNKL